MTDTVVRKENREKVGGVILDYSLYPGEDYYSDGGVEDELLEIVRNREPGDYQDVIEARLDWATLYHLSDVRGNIVRWIPFTGQEKVLEIGAGEGAVTGALSDGCAHVTCIDLSKKRSLINAWRHRDRDNIDILVGNFADIEKTLPAEEYDYIFLIGVLEYAGIYLAGEKEPYLEELKRIRPHLKKDGRIVIAIENRLGMKYFAGCREDHSAVYFDGIEDYPGSAPARTFSKPVLQRLIADAGYETQRFYYPYPDYKLMKTIYSDESLPDADELTDNLRNFDNERLLLFDEKKACAGMLADGLYDLFANSFLAVAGSSAGTGVSCTRFSTERDEPYRIVTAFTEEDGRRRVVKKPYTPAAAAHVSAMAGACGKLQERFAGSPIRVCPCAMEDGNAIFDWQEGITLTKLLDACLQQKDPGGFFRLTGEYRERLSFHETMPASDPDMTFENLLAAAADPAEAVRVPWTAIDYEWFEERPVSGRDMLCRALQVYFRQDPGRRRQLLSLMGAEDDSAIEAQAGLAAGSLLDAEEEEIRFQEKISGGRTPLGQLRAAFGKAVRVPAELTAEQEASSVRKHKADRLGTVQIYTDTGSGYSEENSYFIDAEYQGEGEITFAVNVPETVRRLRIDPALCPCVTVLKEARIGGRTVRSFDKYMQCNGNKCAGAVVFSTADPAMEWDLKKIRRAEKVKGGMECRFTIMMTGLPQGMAAAMDRHHAG